VIVFCRVYLNGNLFYPFLYVIYVWLSLSIHKFEFLSKRLKASSWSLIVGTIRPFAQWNLILGHLKHSKLHIIYMCRMVLATLGTLQWLCVCMVAWNATVVVRLHGCLKRFFGCASAWLRNCMRTKINICSASNFLKVNTVQE